MVTWAILLDWARLVEAGWLKMISLICVNQLGQLGILQEALPVPHKVILLFPLGKAANHVTYSRVCLQRTMTNGAVSGILSHSHHASNPLNFHLRAMLATKCQATIPRKEDSPPSLPGDPEAVKRGL